MKTLASVTAKADYKDDDDHFGDLPKPCACGNLNLLMVETQPPLEKYPNRQAVHCPVCKTQGIDTCHGKTHTIRRWNWYNREITKA